MMQMSSAIIVSTKPRWNMPKPFTAGAFTPQSACRAADLVHGSPTSPVTRCDSGFELAWRRIDSARLAVSSVRRSRPERYFRTGSRPTGLVFVGGQDRDEHAASTLTKSASIVSSVTCAM